MIRVTVRRDVGDPRAREAVEGDPGHTVQGPSVVDGEGFPGRPDHGRSGQEVPERLRKSYSDEATRG